MRASTRDQRVETNQADTAALITNQGRGVADPAQYYATVVVTRGSASEAARSAAEEVSRKNRRDVLVVAVCVAIVAAAFAVIAPLAWGTSTWGAAAISVMMGSVLVGMVWSLLPRRRMSIEGVTFGTGLLSNDDRCEVVMAMYSAIDGPQRDAMFRAEDDEAVEALSDIIGRETMAAQEAERKSRLAAARRKAQSLLDGGAAE